MLTPDDRGAIADLLAAYSFGYDMMEWDLYSSIWTEDAVVVGTGGETLAAVMVGLARAWREDLAGKGIQTRHSQTNTLFEEMTSEFASARTLMFVAHQHAGEAAPRLVHSGVYHDQFRKTAGGWKIARREVVIDHPW